MHTCTQLGNRIRPEYVFAMFALVFGMVSCFLLPPVAGVDEHTHVARVEQLANLNLISDVVKPAEDGDPEKALWGGESDTALWTYAVEHVMGAHEGLELFAEPISLESAGDWAAYDSSGKTWSQKRRLLFWLLLHTRGLSPSVHCSIDAPCLCFVSSAHLPDAFAILFKRVDDAAGSRHVSGHHKRPLCIRPKCHGFTP